MTEVGIRIRLRRKQLGLSQTELGRACGVVQSAVAQWEKGDTKPTAEAMHRMCIALEVGPAWLMYGKAPTKSAGKKIEDSYIDLKQINLSNKVPVISKVQAGTWHEAVDPYEMGEGVEFLFCPQKHSDRTYALEVEGESMLPSFSEGDYIFVDPEVEPSTRDFVVAKNIETNTVTFKQLIFEDSVPILKALNTSWHEPFIPLGDSHEIIGVVIGSYRKLK